MATEVGAGYVSLIPSASGFAAAVIRQIGPPIEAAAALTGKNAGAQLQGGLLGALQGHKVDLLAALGFAGIGLAAFKAAESVDAALDTIQIKTGATGKAAEGLETSFRNVARGTPSSLQTIAEAMSEVAQRTGLTGRGLEGLTRQVVTFNRISGDSPINVQQLTQALAGFNVPASEMGSELDRIFNISKKTGVPLSQLTETLVSAGPIARQFGFSLDFTAGFLAQLNKAGVDASAIMPGLRRAFIQFAQDGREPAAALRETLGEMDRLLKAGDRVGAQNLAVQLFGARGIGLVDAAIAGKVSLASLSEQIDTTGKGILGTARQTDDWREKLAVLRNQATLTLSSLGTPVFDTLGRALGDLVPITGAFASVLGKIEPIIVPALEVLLAMKLAALGAAAAEGLMALATNAVTINMVGFAATAETAAVAAEGVGLSMSTAAGPAAAAFTVGFLGATAVLNRFFSSTDQSKQRLDELAAAEKSLAGAADSELVPAFGRAVAANVRLNLSHGEQSRAAAQAGSTMKVFRDIVEQNVGTAERLAENYRDQPALYAAMQSAIQSTSVQRQQEQSDLQRSTQLTKDLQTAIQDLQSAVLAASGGEIGLQQATANLERAQQTLNDAVRDHGPLSREAADATLGLHSAENQQAAAAIGLDDAVANLTTTYGGNIQALDSEIAKLEDAKRVHPEAAGAIQPLIDRLNDLRGAVDAVPPQKTVTIDVELRNQQLADFAVIARELGLPGAAFGGDLPPGWFGWVGEQGPELMSVGPNGATVVPAKTSRAMIDKAAAAPASGGTGRDEVHFHVDGVPTDGPRLARESARVWHTEKYLRSRV